MRLSHDVIKEVERDVCDGTAVPGSVWFTETIAQICMESPELATTLLRMGMQSMTGGALVYDAMQRQIRKDALAALESREAEPVQAKPGGEGDDE